MYDYFFSNDTATTEIYTLSLHDALPISWSWGRSRRRIRRHGTARCDRAGDRIPSPPSPSCRKHQSRRSEEHTSELQSRQYLVCRLLLEKKRRNECIKSGVAHLTSGRWKF